MSRLDLPAPPKQNGPPRRRRRETTTTMNPPGLTGQDAASIAVLQAQQHSIEKQLTELQRSTNDHLASISGKLDRLQEMGAEIGRIGQSTIHLSESIGRAHHRMDGLARELDEHVASSDQWRDRVTSRVDGRVEQLDSRVNKLDSTKHRWTGIYLGVQAAVALLVALLVWVANSYITRVDAMEKQINRMDRQVQDKIIDRGEKER